MSDEQFVTLLATHLHAWDSLIGMVSERLWDDQPTAEPYKYATPDECIEGARVRLGKVRAAMTPP